MHLIPDSWSHLHILASVFPSVGLVFALGFYVVAMITNNTGLTRICLAVFICWAWWPSRPISAGLAHGTYCPEIPKFPRT